MNTNENKNHATVVKMVTLALLAALVVVLQTVASSIKFGPIPITLTLVPIVIGAILYGPSAGALLGAAALGDIGHLFPDSDDAYAGADSVALLRRVTAVLRECGFVPINVDATVLAQRPKLAPYVPEMRRNLAQAMGLDVSCVSVKATTEEALGFTGREEGMASHAVALIEKCR